MRVSFWAATAVARRGLGAPLLHAALFDNSIKAVALIEPLISWQSLAMNRYYNIDAGDIGTNALTAYDLPDLETSLAPRRLMIANVQDHLLKPASTQLIKESLEVVRRSYADQRAQDRLVIKDWPSFQSIGNIFTPWLKKTDRFCRFPTN